MALVLGLARHWGSLVQWPAFQQVEPYTVELLPVYWLVHFAPFGASLAGVQPAVTPNKSFKPTPLRGAA